MSSNQDARKRTQPPPDDKTSSSQVRGGDDGKGTASGSGSGSGTDDGDTGKTVDKYAANYPIPLWLWLFELVVLILLGLVCFGPAESWAIVRDTKSGVYVGALQTCTGGTCTWLTASSTDSASSSSASTSAGSTRRDSSSTTSSSSSSSSIAGVDTASLYLTLGLGALSAFYLALILFLLTLARFFRPPPPSSSTSPATGAVKNKIKRFAFAVVRLYLGVLGLLVFGLGIKAAVVANAAKGASNGQGWSVVGQGMAALWAAWAMLMLCWIIDYTSPTGRIKGFVMKYDLLRSVRSCFSGCGCDGCGCGGCCSTDESDAEKGQRKPGSSSGDGGQYTRQEGMRRTKPS